MKGRIFLTTLLVVVLATSFLMPYTVAQEEVDPVAAELEANEFHRQNPPFRTGEPGLSSQKGGTPDTVLYFWDFEGTNGGFAGTLDWEWGTYAWAGTCGTYYEPPAAYSGTDMWGTVLNECYNNLGNNAGYDTCINGNPADDSILSFTIDLTGVTDPVEMSWWEWYDLYMNWDWGEVYANGNVVFQHCGTGYIIPTAWEEQVADLTPYIGGLVDIEFHMMASSVVERAGWWIDNVMVYTLEPAPDLTTSYKTAPIQVEQGDPIDYTVVLSNTGLLDTVGTLMTDTIPAGTTYIPGSLSCSAGTCWEDGLAVYWNGVVPTDTMVTVDFSVDTSGADCGVQINNTAVISDPSLFLPLSVSAGTELIGAGYYAWDFEADDGGFVPDPIGEWEWGMPDPSYPDGPAGAHSGVNVWGTDLDGDAEDGIDGHLLTKTLTIPADPNGVFLQWWDWYGDEASDERQIWIDGVEVWNDNAGTDQTYWDYHTLDISAWAGQTVDLVFRLEVCCANPGPEGWYIDDVTIYGGCYVPTPNIVIDAPPLEADLCPDATETLTFTICNTGDAPLVWEIEEMSRTLQLATVPSSGGSSLGQPASASTRVVPPPRVTSEADCAAYENYAGAEPLGYAEFCGGTVPSPAVGGPAPAAPTDIGFAQDIGYISDNFVTFLLNDFPGQTVLGTTTNVYYGMDFDPTGTTLYALNDTTGELGTIDLADGTFTGLVPCPAPVDIWTGLTIDPVTGVFYASDITNLYTIDPATGNYTLVGPFGTSAMIDIAMGPNGEMYGHDINTDSIYWIDPATGAATLIGGPTGYAANFAQGLDFDNEDGTLYIFLYIGSGANVYGIVDLATGGVIPLAVDNPTGEFEGATQTTAMPSDVPWLTEVPTNGVLAPDLCEVVEVTFDATGVTPGEHLADLIITSNDPLTPVVTLPATLTVGAPAGILDVAYDVDGLTVAFDALVAGDEPLTYAWDLGDGNTSDLEDPVHTYEQAGCYTVTLDVENACGTDTWSAEICLCEPVAGIGFAWMPTEPTVDATVYFSATEPMTGTPPFTYTWDFGDGMNDQGMYVTHVYTAAGDYEVTVMVENACGENWMTDTVTVAPGCDPVAGVDFSWAPVTPTVDATVYLTASAAFGTPPFTYTWDFGDGSTGEGMAVTHVYTAAGDYEVTVMVENACGENWMTDTVMVEAGMHYIYLPIVVKNN